MISSISILQDSQYLGGKGGGVVWPLMSKKNYEVFLRNMWIAIMIPVALEKDHRLEGEVGLSVERTDSL